MVEVVVGNGIVLCLVVGGTVLVAAVHHDIGNLLVALEELKRISARIGGNATHGVEGILLLTESDEGHDEACKVEFAHAADVVVGIGFVLAIEIAGVFHIFIT